MAERFGIDTANRWLASVYALKVIDLIQFGNISPAVGMLYARDVVGLLGVRNKAAQLAYLEQYRPQIENEIKVACMDALCQLYQPFLSGEYRHSRSKGIPIDIVQMLRNARAVNTGQYGPYSEFDRNLEALEASVRGMDVLQIDGHVATALSLGEVAECLVAELSTNIVDCTEPYLRYHTKILSILYRLFAPVAGRPEEVYDNRMGGHRRDVWVESFPCQTPEAVIGITERDEYEPVAPFDRSPSPVFEPVVRYLCILSEIL